MKNRFSFSRVVVLIAMLIVTIVCGQTSSVYAEIITGDGSSSSSAEFRGCDKAQRWQNVRECSGKHGGASWHVFKTDKKPVQDFNSPNYDDRPILTRSLASKYSWDDVGQCPSGYYIAFVYDGWYGYGSNWNRKSLIFYGPLAWGEYEQSDGNSHHTPVYHKGGTSYTAAQVTAGFKNGTNMNGWRISGEGPTDAYKRASRANWKSTEATKLFRMYAGNNSANIPKGTGWFCYNPPSYTLTAKAVNTNGSSLADVMADRSNTVIEGNRASVSRRTAAGYTFLGWSTSINNAKNKTFVTSTSTNSDNFVSGDNNPKETFNVKAISANTTVYAVYERNTFGGRIVLSGTASGSIPDGNGYTTSSSSSPKYVEIKNCSPTTGCSAVFEDYVKRIAGGGTTPYTVSRTSNLFNTTRGISNSPNVKSDNSGNPNGERVVRDPGSGSYTLYPGMVVCESLAFKVYSTDANKTTITLCAAATGNAQPPDPGDGDTRDPSNDTSLYNIKVKNTSVGKYNNWQKRVYAKPGDSLTYMASYYPWLQYTYALVPGAIRFNSAGSTYPTNGSANTSKYLGKDAGGVRSMFNEYGRGIGLGTWKNAINVYDNGSFATSFNRSYTNYPLGEIMTVNKPHTEPNDHAVSFGEVGKSLDEIVTTNSNASTNSTPTQANFSLSGSRSVANVITGKNQKTASAIVPYNYETDTEITTKDDTILYAGETFPVDYSYIIKPRNNSETMNAGDRNYATTVGNPTWKIAMRIENGGGAWETATYDTKISNNKDEFSIVSNEQMFNGHTVSLNTSVVIPDVPAGTRVCFKSIITPATSGLPTSTDPNGDGKEKASAEKCFTVAKRPSIQIWGGNVYTQNPIVTGSSAKSHIEGFTEFKIEDKKIKRVFGSWGELGVIAGNVVSGFGSGASTGFASNTDGVLSPSQSSNTISNTDPGGSDRTNFCLRSQLTFANKCNEGKVGGVGNTTASGNAQNDKSKVIEKIAAGDHTELASNTITVNDSLAEYTYGGEDLTIQCSGDCSVGNGIKMVRSDKDITINSNIIYTGRYTELSKIPKVVIYANKVNISCGVTHIDALIIADRTVDTCPDSAGKKINERKNSNQLVVNGAIIASKLAAHRTYGAATGTNSIVPAEIINFDPSLYMWGGDDKEDEGGGDGNDSETGANNLNVTYIRELAPRK